MRATYAYLHGFGSSPESEKGVALRRILGAQGVELHIPDLNRPSFAEITVSGALGVVDDFADGYAGPGPMRFIGSSFGGLVAARWVELHADRTDRLLLLCPGFDLPSRWLELYGPEEIEAWATRGWAEHPDVNGVTTRIHFGFCTDVAEHPLFPTPACPTVIIHGRNDEVVPVEISRGYARDRPNVTLLEVDDDHSLAGSAEYVAEVAMEFLVSGGTDGLTA